MHISKIRIRNFRLLKDTSIDVKTGMSLFIGKNNSGKTSLIVLLENFFKGNQFHFNDFSISLRKKICNLTHSCNENDLSIQLIIEIEYSKEDSDLGVLSKFMLDLDPAYRHVKIMFECRILKDKLLNKVSDLNDKKKSRFIEQNVHNYLEYKVYAFDDNFEETKNETNGDKADPDNVDKNAETNAVNQDKKTDLYFQNIRKTFKARERKDVTDLIHLEIIHAKRDVSSSEYSGNKAPLSTLTTKHFNNQNDKDESNEKIDSINDLVTNMDESLNEKYQPVFKGFLKNAKEFLSFDKIKVISDIQSQTLLKNSSKVIYGDNDDYLPENLNGLGYLNILYLLLTLEMKKELFGKEKHSINLLLIEEPEAHTHPQMQYIFASKIEKVLSDVKGLQTFITSHSSCVVTHSNFEDLRYLKHEENNVEIKNFHTELKEKYINEEENFKFLKQYLNIQSAELFFAEKVIFIEGTTEKMLLPLFINTVDEENKGDKSYTPLSSQNISILEVGANAKAFSHFLEFLGIKTLIITDIDTTKQTTSKNGSTTYKACAVEDEGSKFTSNASIKYFLSSPKIDDIDYESWFKDLINNKLSSSFSNIKIAYQTKEENNHARSFEDAFININFDRIMKHKDALLGLKNKNKIVTEAEIYDLTNEIIDKKSDIAASILYFELSGKVDWNCPQYIKEGLTWLVKA